MTRRAGMLIHSICCAMLALAFSGMAGADARADEFVVSTSSLATPQGAYAERKLRAAIGSRALYALVNPGQKAENKVGIHVALGTDAALGAEAFSISRDGETLRINGGDARGLIYGALAVAEAVRNGQLLQEIEPRTEKPKLEFRGIKFNTPWDTYRPSSALDQHYATARDLKFWEGFLDMMVENRFNAVSLWTMNPFTYMVRPKSFPEASPWTKREQAEWQKLYRGVFALAKERGLDTYIVFWSIFVSRELAEKHGVAKQNFYPNYYVPGDTSEVTKRYLREGVTQVLEEYPDLDGIGVSHGEGMAGMTPIERQKFVDEVYIAGALEASKKRPVKLIHRVPFSSGTSSEPGVSKGVEEVTRVAMEKLGNSFSGPIWVEMKFNWSHAQSTPKLVKVHGGKLGDTYFEPRPANYKVTWMARNENFFALRWGVPSFIREHIARNGVQDYVGGYFIGSETYIPALDYFTKVEHPQWKWAFERQWLFYKLWGRLLYDAATPDSVFQAEYTRRYGERGKNLLNAMSLASNTQMRLGSLWDSRWDFTLYGEGFIALQGEYTKYIGVDALIKQPVMDPDYVSVAEYVKTLAEGGSFGAGRVTPPALIAALERDNAEALRLVSGIDTQGDVALAYEVADVKVWAHLGLHLAKKLRGAISLAKFRSSGKEELKEMAALDIVQALEHWDKIVAITQPLYNDMRLTHYNHNFFTANPDNLFHWARVRDEVAKDLETVRAATVSAPATGTP
jgi:hypothetical protein